MIALALLVAARTLTLDEAVVLAEERSVPLDAAKIQEERAQLQTLRANLERVHATVDASVGELYDKPNLFGPGGSPDILLGLSSLEARLGVPLFSGFRVEAGIAGAEYLQKASLEETERQRRDLVIAVARAYWSVRRLGLLEEAQRASTERLVESERLVAARVAAGLAPGLDVNRAAARGLRLAVERTSLESQRAEASVRLAVLLGVPLDGGEELVLVDAPPPADAPLERADVLVQRAFDARPELRAADLQSLALAEEQRAAESGYWPQLDAGLLMQLGNNPALAGVGSRSVSGAAAFPFSNVVGDVQVGLTLRMNLFDTFRTTHAVEDLGHRRRIAALERTEIGRVVESDVRVAHARVAGLRSQREALVKARALVGDNLVILERAYQRGEVLFTEVLDVQVDLADAEREIVDVDAQLALARLELAAAIGEAPVKSTGVTP